MKSGALAGCARATWDIQPMVQVASLILIVLQTILGLFWEVPMQLVCFLGYSGVFPLAYIISFPMISAYWDRVCEAK